MSKRYCGDGVYCAVDAQRITLTTENGITVLQEIILEWPVFDAFLEFVNEQIEIMRAEKAARQLGKGLFDDN
jgi:hypothetical protein